MSDLSQEEMLNMVSWGFNKGNDLAHFHLKRATHFHAALKQISRAEDEGRSVSSIVEIANEALKETFKVEDDD